MWSFGIVGSGESRGVQQEIGSAEIVLGDEEAGVAGEQRDVGAAEEGVGECAVGESGTGDVYPAAAFQGTITGETSGSGFGFEMCSGYGAIGGW